jgi:protein subunit release factor B
VAEAEEPFRVVVRIAGPGAYGYLAGEAGLHRRIEDEKRQRAYVRVHRGGPVEEEESLDVEGREVRRHEGTYLARVKTEVTVRDETTGRMMTLAGAGELDEMKDLASRVVKGQGGSNTADEARRYHLGRGARVEDPRTGAGTPRVKDVLRGELDVFIAAWISRPPTSGPPAP